jgi:hypothetical protein
LLALRRRVLVDHHSGRWSSGGLGSALHLLEQLYSPLYYPETSTLSELVCDLYVAWLKLVSEKAPGILNYIEPCKLKFSALRVI